MPGPGPGTWRPAAWLAGDAACGRRRAACVVRPPSAPRYEENIVSLPPLVEPAAELTIDEVRRYSRHLIIPDVGMAGQKRLKNAKVLVIGAGGLGSPALLYLAAAGVGTLGIVEFDEVDESNLQRQIIHGQSDIGKPKAHLRPGVDRRDQPARQRRRAQRAPRQRQRARHLRAVRPDRRRHRQLRDPLHGQRRGRTSWTSPTSGARSTASTARRRSSGRRSRAPRRRATAASTPNRRRRAWSRPAPRAACSACSARASARSRSTRPSSC